MTPRLIVILATLSGIPGLGYQVLWSRMLSTGLGRDYVALISSSAAFLMGMALGCLWFVRSPFARRAPLRAFALWEALAGAWMLVMPLVSPTLQQSCTHRLGVSPPLWQIWGITLGLSFVLLLPIAMGQGMSVLLLNRALAADATRVRGNSGLYASNTWGALLGLATTTWGLLPALGIRRTTFCLAALNLVAAALAWRRSPTSSLKTPHAHAEAQRTETATSPVRLAKLAAAGFLGVGFQLLVVRGLAQVLENTVYTFALCLGVYLACNALGAALWNPAKPVENRDRGWMQTATALILCGLGGALFVIHLDTPYQALRTALGDSVGSVFVAESLVVLTALGPVSACMGHLFARLWCGSNRPASAWTVTGADTSQAKDYAANLVGAGVAPVVWSWALAPALGLKPSLVVLCLAYIPWIAPLRAWGWRLLPIAAASALLLLISPRPPRETADRTIARVEGPSVEASVVESSNGRRTLRVNRRFQMGGTGAVTPQRRQAHIPLLLHPAPHEALFLGMGTGITFAAATLHPGLAADSVELLPEVERLRPQFAPENAWTPSPRFRVVISDARRFVRATDRRYDVVVADLFHPALDGVGALYTQEHFAAIRSVLKQDGLFCQWLPLHQMDLPTFHAITRTFLSVFPEAQAVVLRFAVDVPVIGLVSRLPAASMSETLVQRMSAPELAAQLRELGLNDPFKLFGCTFASTAQLESWSKDAVINTDDNQWVTFHAPAFSYLTQAPPHARFAALLEAVGGPSAPRPASTPSVSVDFDTRLNRFIAGRNVYLKALLLEAQGDLPGAMRGYVNSARWSPDFTLGYAQCLSLIPMLADRQPQVVREILKALVEARPEQRIAGELLRRLDEREAHPSNK